MIKLHIGRVFNIYSRVKIIIKLRSLRVIWGGGFSGPGIIYFTRLDAGYKVAVFVFI